MQHTFTAIKREDPTFYPRQRIPRAKVAAHNLLRVLKQSNTRVFARFRTKQAIKLRDFSIDRNGHPKVMNKQIDQVTTNDKKRPTNVIRLVKVRCRRFLKRTAPMNSHL